MNSARPGPIEANLYSALDENLAIIAQNLDKLGNVQNWRRPSTAEDLSVHIKRCFPSLKQGLSNLLQELEDDTEQSQRAVMTNLPRVARGTKRVRTEGARVHGEVNVPGSHIIPIPSIEAPGEYVPPPIWTQNQRGPIVNPAAHPYPMGRRQEIHLWQGEHHFQQPQVWNSANMSNRPVQQAMYKNQATVQQLSQWARHQNQPQTPPDISNNPTIQILQIKQYETHTKAQETDVHLTKLFQMINSIEEKLDSLKHVQENLSRTQREFDGVKKYCEGWKDMVEKETVALVQNSWKDRVISKDEMDEERKLVLGNC